MKSVKFLITMTSIMLSALASQAQQHKTQLLELKKEKKKINVAFLIYDQVEAMDPGYHLYTVSASGKKIVSSEGGTVMMQSTYSFENAHRQTDQWKRNSRSNPKNYGL